SVPGELGELAPYLKYIVLDTKGYIYVTDYDNNCVKKLREDQGGDTLTLVDKWGSVDSGDFTYPLGIAVDAEGNLYVADSGDDPIQKINQDDGTISPWYGYGSIQGEFNEPYGITIDTAQNIYVTNRGNGCIQKFSPEGTIFNWEFDGEPNDLAVVSEGYIYVVELKEGDDGSYNHRILKFSPQGTHLASWASGGEGKGEFKSPYGIAVHEEDGEAHIYVADTFNNRVQKFTSDGTWEKTWGSPEWSFHSPKGIAIDAAGSIYIADRWNHRILKINPDESSVEWNLGYSYKPYGVAVDASGENIYIAAELGIFPQILKLNPVDGSFSNWGSGFNNPRGVTVGADGNVYVADTYNHLIKKCNPDGTSCTPCGSGFLYYPKGVAVDAELNIYVADTGNDSIKIFDPDCTPPPKTLGEFGNLPNQLSDPSNLAVDSDGRVYVSDSGNNRIQVFKKVTLLKKTKAIIVAGRKSPEDSLWDATQATANFAYRTFIYRGLQKEDIRYLSSNTALDFEGDGVPDVTAVPTENSLRDAITQWIREEPAADSLVLYFSDHGTSNPEGGIFHLNEHETLTSDDLASWLDTIEGELSDRIVAVIDACESGSFQDDLEGDDRIIITSTSPGERAKFLNQGTISFSSFFLTHIFSGLSIDESFLKARQVITFAFDNQNPLLSGSAENIYIGNESEQMIGDAPYIEGKSPSQKIEEGTSAEIYADVTDPNGDSIARVWAVIWSPDLDL
ncbi:MAG: caspase family protein, partial [Deltaproteobacteria bacterium]|nr:caspase family protein [Deltaproteobacteria bacterium]